MNTNEINEQLDKLKEQHNEGRRLQFVLDVLWFVDGLTTQTDSIFPTGTTITIKHLCDHSITDVERLVNSELTLVGADIGWTKAKATIDSHHRCIEEEHKERESFQQAREQYWIHQQNELDKARRIKEQRKAILMNKDFRKPPHRGVW